MDTRTCKHPGCDRTARAVGHCARHRIQFREHGYTFDIGQILGRASHRCQHEGCDALTPSAFCPEHRADLGQCQSVDCTDLRRSPRVAYCDAHCRKNRTIRHFYGITLLEYETIITSQGGRCAICRRETPLHLDHCHDTGKVRGMLCGNCNRGIGLLAHDPTVLRAALAYLEGR